MYSSLAAQAKWNSNHLMLNDDDDDDDPDCFSSGLLSFHETFKSFLELFTGHELWRGKNID